MQDAVVVILCGVISSVAGAGSPQTVSLAANAVSRRIQFKLYFPAVPDTSLSDHSRLRSSMNENFAVRRTGLSVADKAFTDAWNVTPEGIKHTHYRASFHTKLKIHSYAAFAAVARCGLLLQTE